MLYIFNNRSYAALNEMAQPGGSHSDSCDTEYQNDDGETLFPMGIVQFGVFRILVLSVKNLANHTQNIHGGYDNTRRGENGQYPVECIGVLE